jgi:hypothetical protein
LPARLVAPARIALLTALGTSATKGIGHARAKVGVLMVGIGAWSTTRWVLGRHGGHGWLHGEEGMMFVCVCIGCIVGLEMK